MMSSLIDNIDLMNMSTYGHWATNVHFQVCYINSVRRGFSSYCLTGFNEEITLSVINCCVFIEEIPS